MDVMGCIFENHLGNYGFFKVFFERVIIDWNSFYWLDKITSHEDIIFDESTGCFFHDEDGEALEGVQILYLDEILEISNEEFYQLLIIGIKKYLLKCPEDSDKMKKALDELLDKCKDITKKIPDDF